VRRRSGGVRQQQRSVQRPGGFAGRRRSRVQPHRACDDQQKGFAGGHRKSAGDTTIVLTNNAVALFNADPVLTNKAASSSNNGALVTDIVAAPANKASRQANAEPVSPDKTLMSANKMVLSA